VSQDRTLGWHAAGHLAQILAICLFTVGVVVQKTLAVDNDPGDVLVLQFAAAAMLLWLVLLARGHRVTWCRHTVLTLAWGAMAPGCVLILSMYGAARTDAVSLSLIWGVVPLIGPVIGRVLLGERMSWAMPVGGAIGFGGLVLLTLNREALGVGDMAGNLMVLGAAILATLSQVFGRRLNAGDRPWLVTATLQVTGAVITTGLAALADGAWASPDLTDRGTAIAMLYLVLGMSTLNFLAFNFALKRVPMAWISIYIALSPAIGTLTGVVLLGSLVRPVDMLGIAVIAAGVAFPHAIRFRRRG